MPDKTWKANERKVARYWGCRRKGPMQEKDANDIDHPHIHCQVKYSKHTPSNVKICDRAKAKTKKNGKIPCVAYCVKDRPGFFITCHNSDLQALAHQRKLAVRDEIIATLRCVKRRMTDPPRHPVSPSKHPTP